MEFIETRSFKIVHGAFKKAMSENGWLMVSGDVGFGKTTIKDELTARYGTKSACKIIEVRCMHGLKINSVMRKVVRTLSSETPTRDSDALVEQFTRIIGGASYQRKIVVLIDEAQDMPFQTMQCLKRLHEIRFGTHENLFSIILFGHPKLKNYLLTEEIGLRVKHLEMQGLTETEAREILSKYPFEDQALDLFIETVNLTPLAVRKTAEELDSMRQSMPNENEKITSRMVHFMASKELKDLQKKAGVSDRDIAKGTGLSVTVVNQTKNGIYPGNIEDAKKDIRTFLFDTIEKQESEMGKKNQKASNY